MDDILSDEDKSESDIIKLCERELQDMELKRYDKRPRESENSSEEGFITVNRRRPKRLIRSDSAVNYDKNFDMEDNVDIGRKYEVCLTSLKVLPKQMALARFLRDENIININKIKYKSPYRVYVQFENIVQAENLIKNQKLVDLDIRAQFTDQNNVSYGIIKGVDLDIDEKELLENLNATCDILSARRLRRRNSEDEWVESETVRLSFKSISAPSFVIAYGCKCDVEKYVFPVTQCSKCWRFGHIKKFCSLNKDVCPKCGQGHSNCEIQKFICPNCKGPHMALNKSCPYFIKEKKIREIMSEQNITYKKALEIFLMKEIPKEKTRVEEEPINTDSINSQTLPPINMNRSYSSVLRTTAVVHESENNQGKERNMGYSQLQKEKKETIKKTKEHKNQQFEKEVMEVETENFEGERVQPREEITLENLEKRKQRKFDIWNLILKIKNIVMSEESFIDKCILVLRVIVGECKEFFMKIFSDVGIVENLFNLFNGQSS